MAEINFKNHLEVAEKAQPYHGMVEDIKQDSKENNVSQSDNEYSGINSIMLDTKYLQHNDLKIYKAYAEKALSNNPLQTEAYNILGQIYQKENDTDNAIFYFQQAIRIDPRYVDAYTNLAALFTDIGDLEKAIQTYVTVLQVNPLLYCIRNYLGTLLKEQGRISEAKTCFLRALEMKPDYAAAWNNLGCIYHTENEHWLAIHHFEKATIMDPLFYEAFLNLGNVLKDAKIMDKARIAYEKALEISPDSAILVANLAFVYSEVGLKELAINFYKKSIELQPNFSDAYCNLANILKDLQRVTESETYYQTALSYNPAHPDSLNNLGNIRREQGNLDEALSFYKKALNVLPDFAVAHSNIACIHKLKGNLDKAMKHYEEVLRIQPSCSDTYNNMGNILKEMLDVDGAFSCFEKAIKLNPISADAHCNKANMYKDCGNVSEAIKWYKYCLQLKPYFPDAYSNMVHCLLSICEWSNYSGHVQAINNLTEEQLKTNLFPSVHPHHSMLYVFQNNLIHKQIAEKHAKFCMDKMQINKWVPFVFFRTLKTKLKIGYVSSDFGNHPTSHLMQSIPNIHDRALFEVYCYSLSPCDGTAFYYKIKNGCDHFVDLSEIPCNYTAAKMIHNQGIHILINMNGYTKGARNEIFTLRPAPIQVMWLGFPGTSGSTFIDYLITDKVTCPQRFSHYYSEKFAYMPDSFFIGDHCQMFPHLQERIVLIDQCQTTSYTSETNVVLNTVNTKELIKCEYIKKYKELCHLAVELPLATLESMIESGKTDVYLNGLTIKNGLTLNAENPKVGTGEEIPKSVIVTMRQHYGLPNDCIVYCNFNQLYKLDPNTFSIWAMILHQVPNSVLWLLRFPPEGEENIRNTAADLGLEQHRIIFSDVAQKEEHVRRGQLADICLDTVMCNGHTTNMDILWTGTPVITLPAISSASRIGASQLYGLRCSELIAETKEEYQTLAIKLGTDRELLATTRAKINTLRKLSPLFNCSTFVRNLEKLYSKMWSRYENNLEPMHIDIFKDTD